MTCLGQCGELAPAAAARLVDSYLQGPKNPPGLLKKEWFTQQSKWPRQGRLQCGVPRADASHNQRRRPQKGVLAVPISKQGAGAIRWAWEANSQASCAALPHAGARMSASCAAVSSPLAAGRPSPPGGPRRQPYRRPAASLLHEAAEHVVPQLVAAAVRRQAKVHVPEIKLAVRRVEPRAPHQADVAPHVRRRDHAVVAAGSDVDRHVEAPVFGGDVGRRRAAVVREVG